MCTHVIGGCLIWCVAGSVPQLEATSTHKAPSHRGAPWPAETGSPATEGNLSPSSCQLWVSVAPRSCQESLAAADASWILAVMEYGCDLPGLRLSCIPRSGRSWQPRRGSQLWALASCWCRGAWTRFGSPCIGNNAQWDLMHYLTTVH